MLTREVPQPLSTRTTRPALQNLVGAACLSVLLVMGAGAVERAWSAPGEDDPSEYRIPMPGEKNGGGAHGQGELGNPGGTTDADPDEFSVNNVGIRRPDVAVQPIGSGGTSQGGGWISRLHLSMWMLLRLWLALGVGR